MQRSEYEKLASTEDRMWWFRGMHANMLAMLDSVRVPAGPLLDAGCGTGGFLRRLAAASPGSAVGLDLDPVACSIARRKSARPVCAGSVAALPFPDASLAAIFSADVLCHAGVDDVATLAEFRRCLAPGGVLILNLPAYGWLLSEHDRAVDNVRRYTAGGVKRRLRDAGFANPRISYWNTVLFPLMVIRRKLLRTGASDVSLSPAPLEAMFSAVMRLETLFLRAGLRFPFGGSVLALAVKHA